MLSEQAHDEWAYATGATRRFNGLHSCVDAIPGNVGGITDSGAPLELEICRKLQTMALSFHLLVFCASSTAK